MKKFLPNLLLSLFLALLNTGCHSLNQKEQLLTAAGFRTVVPTTPAQSAHLAALPQGHLTPVTKNGQTLFILADAKHNSLFVGNQSEYQAYQQLRLKQQLSQDKLATAAMNADATAEWNAWGGLEGTLWGPGFN